MNKTIQNGEYVNNDYPESSLPLFKLIATIVCYNNASSNLEIKILGLEARLRVLRISPNSERVSS